jgi:hypothetical protein
MTDEPNDKAEKEAGDEFARVVGDDSRAGGSAAEEYTPTRFP